ncbi:hypothetical protein CEXT_637251 [Caerostris extrusa]|uniref:Uncharacterized protein n=1 Tax=Caerostris extrusa TaxID=172846 RepID=A0AAV4Y932_CAEEX|nr:hypothetical protein CEXT_637251 [Caerostris extrusa]
MSSDFGGSLEYTNRMRVLNSNPDLRIWLCSKRSGIDCHLHFAQTRCTHQFPAPDLLARNLIHFSVLLAPHPTSDFRRANNLLNTNTKGQKRFGQHASRVIRSSYISLGLNTERSDLWVLNSNPDLRIWLCSKRYGIDFHLPFAQTRAHQFTAPDLLARNLIHFSVLLAPHLASDFRRANNLLNTNTKGQERVGQHASRVIRSSYISAGLKHRTFESMGSIDWHMDRLGKRLSVYS